MAANPKMFAEGTHIRTNYHELLVIYTDESIPYDTVYVYMEDHDHHVDSTFSGILDVYKEK